MPNAFVNSEVAAGCVRFFIEASAQAAVLAQAVVYARINCGCDCCGSENPPVLPDDALRCPFHGCQPEWAARPTVGEDQSGASVGHLG